MVSHTPSIPITITDVTNNTVTLSAAIGAAFPADSVVKTGGGGHAGNPVLCIKHNNVLTHELLHNTSLSDVVPTTNIMHGGASATGTKLRHMPKTLFYDSSNDQNQWESVDR
jgi:hypothetical protein